MGGDVPGTHDTATFGQPPQHGRDQTPSGIDSELSGQEPPVAMWFDATAPGRETELDADAGAGAGYHHLPR